MGGIRNGCCEIAGGLAIRTMVSGVWMRLAVVVVARSGGAMAADVMVAGRGVAISSPS